MGGGKRRKETRRAGGDPADTMIINQIMLRFRPIAPRPVSVEGSVGLLSVKEKRTKRKYVRVKKTNKKKKEVGEEVNFTNYLTMKEDNGCDFVTDPVRKVPEWICFDVYGHNQNNRWMSSLQPSVGLHDVDLAMRTTERKLVESWITMESVIGTCEDERQLGYTDEEIWKDLESDGCPGFVSNGYDEVQWVNLSYRKMVDPDIVNELETNQPQVVVWLVVKVEKAAFEHWPAFSCRVRVEYDRLSEKKMKMTVPCDVWKMDSGWYAWRLDVKAALSLGRLS